MMSICQTLDDQIMYIGVTDSDYEKLEHLLEDDPSVTVVYMSEDELPETQEELVALHNARL